SDSAHDLNGRAIGLPRISFSKRVAPILKRMPWPFLLLGLGIVLAIVAIYLRVFDVGGELPTFLLAALAMGSGLALIMRHSAHAEQHPPVDEPPPTMPHIYRERTCGIDPAVLLKLTKAVQALEERVKEKSWEMNQRTYQEALDKGQRLHKQGDLV